MLHGVAGTWGEAAAAALTAGIDVELPTVHAFGAPLRRGGPRRPARRGRRRPRAAPGARAEAAARPARPGLVAGPACAAPDGDLDDPESLRGTIDLDPPENRALAREIAEQSVVLLRNDGMLPLARARAHRGGRPQRRRPVRGARLLLVPRAHRRAPPRRAARHRAADPARRDRAPSSPTPRSMHALGTTIDGGETDGIAAAVAARAIAPTSSCSRSATAPDCSAGAPAARAAMSSRLMLPGAQQQLLDALLATGTPRRGHPAVGPPVRPRPRGDARPAAIVQTFFPGEEGAAGDRRRAQRTRQPERPASGERPPLTGRPAVDLPRGAARVRRARCRTSTRPPRSRSAPGIGYSDVRVDRPRRRHATETGTDGAVELSLTVRNTGDRAGAEVVQLYLHDPVASVVRPVQRLIGFTPGARSSRGSRARDRATVPADLASFTGRDRRRIVEPGELVLGFGRSSGDIPLTHTVDADRAGARGRSHPRAAPGLDADPT